MTSSIDSNGPVIWDVLIIGAGLAGLSAANDLHRAGLKVLVVDKGRGLGGRLAGRRIGDATFDHGAQFMTARDSRFKATVAEWIEAGVAEEWYSSYPGHPNGHPRYRGVPTMTAVAKYLATDMNVLRTTRVDSIRQGSAQDNQLWSAALDSGETVNAKALLITSPVPQTIDLLASGNIPVPADKQARLDRIDYEACIAVMAVLDRPTTIPAPGATAFDQGPIGWISDNLQKGVSKIPAVTIHGSGAFSADHYEDDKMQTGQILIDAASPYLGDAKVTEYQVHGWRYSKPSVLDPEACMLLSESTSLPPLALAGDAFAGPRFEGAVLSGWAAAKSLITALA
ncbi:FAD-dependent oxidoreductase [Porticoccaceae bacterium]|nr:FAD-dependent oxidoreductase [Porticoccaceae bacterium]MDC0011446.1 FAD-dependent oxidoreductase [Porticoccaceae bacterium]